jgi:hypothetical protein
MGRYAAACVGSASGLRMGVMVPSVKREGEWPVCEMAVNRRACQQRSPHLVSQGPQVVGDPVRTGRGVTGQATHGLLYLSRGHQGGARGVSVSRVNGSDSASLQLGPDGLQDLGLGLVGRWVSGALGTDVGIVGSEAVSNGSRGVQLASISTGHGRNVSSVRRWAQQLAEWP